MAVYDAFMFFNEFDLLSVRLEEHNPFVDYFILVQADRTFTGHKKELLFSKSDPRFQKYSHKIIVVNVELKENPISAWDNEGAQRQAALTAVKFSPDDIIFLADSDEIISREHWPYLLERMKKELVIGVWLRMFYYFINLELIDHPWAMPKLIKGKTLLEANPNGNTLRSSPAAVTTPFPCGWHFSYLSTVNKIIEKISSFSHQENNTEQFNNSQSIREAIHQKKDLFGRNMVFSPVEVDASWPKAMLKSNDWQDFICPVGFFDSKLAKIEAFIEPMKEKFKPMIKPLLKRLRLTQGTPDTYNGFGSDLFESLISARPKEQDPREWRRLIEFFALTLPDLEGWFSARQCAELFMQIVGRLKPGSKIVEVGSWKGRSSVFASRAAAIVDSTLYCVDTWRGNFGEGESHTSVREAKKVDVFQEFKNNISRFGCDNVVICRGDSLEVAKNWNHGSIDFLFIDASHDYDSVMEDLKAWVPHLKPGGFVCGDDWNREEQVELKGSVRKAFQDFFKLDLPNLGIVERFWAHQVR